MFVGVHTTQMTTGDVCVVSENTVRLLLTPLLGEADVASHVAPIVWDFAYIHRLIDIMRYLRPAFKGWEKQVSFHPLPSVAPNLNDHWTNKSAVFDYLQYHNRYFMRPKHSAGVTFATFVRLHGEEVGVVWTTARKAHMYRYRDSEWTLFKTLNRQDDPFTTWLRFLGGNAMVERETFGRSPEQVFHDLVVPYFGTTRHARDVTRMRSISSTSPVWDLVKKTSYATVPRESPLRMNWVEI